MRFLIAITSCKKWQNRGDHEVMEAAWLNEAKALGLDYQFFTEEDPVMDDYFHLSYKTRRKARCMIANQYDYSFFCHADTYARPERLLAAGFERFDYYGHLHGTEGRADQFALGGPGFFLSQRACRYLAHAKVTGYGMDKFTETAEDSWVGLALLDKNLKIAHCENFLEYGDRNPGPLKTDLIIGAHLSHTPGGYTSETMRRKAEEWRISNVSNC